MLETTPPCDESLSIYSRHHFRWRSHGKAFAHPDRKKLAGRGWQMLGLYFAYFLKVGPLREQVAPLPRGQQQWVAAEEALASWPEFPGWRSVAYRPRAPSGLGWR